MYKHQRIHEEITMKSSNCANCGRGEGKHIPGTHEILLPLGGFLEKIWFFDGFENYMIFEKFRLIANGNKNVFEVTPKHISMVERYKLEMRTDSYSSLVLECYLSSGITAEALPHDLELMLSRNFE